MPSKRPAPLCEELLVPGSTPNVGSAGGHSATLLGRTNVVPQIIVKKPVVSTPTSGPTAQATAEANQTATPSGFRHIVTPLASAGSVPWSFTPMATPSPSARVGVLEQLRLACQPTSKLSTVPVNAYSGQSTYQGAPVTSVVTAPPVFLNTTTQQYTSTPAPMQSPQVYMGTPAPAPHHLMQPIQPPPPVQPASTGRLAQTVTAPQLLSVPAAPCRAPGMPLAGNMGLGVLRQAPAAPPTDGKPHAISLRDALGQTDAARKKEEEEDDNDDDDSDDEGMMQPQTIRNLEDVPKPPPGALHPSIGSEGHATGNCKRCCFFPRGRCMNGYECEFCHNEHEKRKRKNKKKSKKVTPTPVSSPLPGLSASARPFVPCTTETISYGAQTTTMEQSQVSNQIVNNANYSYPVQQANYSSPPSQQTQMVSVGAQQECYIQGTQPMQSQGNQGQNPCTHVVMLEPGYMSAQTQQSATLATPCSTSAPPPPPPLQRPGAPRVPLLANVPPPPMRSPRLLKQPAA